VLQVEADRISFYFSFTVPNKQIFLFFGILFFGRKTDHFSFFFYFSVRKTAVKRTENECKHCSSAIA